MKEEFSESLTLTLKKQSLQKMITKEQLFVQSKKTEISINGIRLNKADYEQNNYSVPT